MNGAEASFKASVQDAGCPSGKPRVTHHLYIFITASAFPLSISYSPSLALSPSMISDFILQFHFILFFLTSASLSPCLSLFPSFVYIFLIFSLFFLFHYLPPSPSSPLQLPTVIVFNGGCCISCMIFNASKLLCL